MIGPMAGIAMVTPSQGRADSRQPARRPSRPPYHPDLQQLAASKRTWAERLDPDARARGFLGWHQRGYLPHRDVPGVIQFVTFRLRDALPSSRRPEWQAMLQIEDERQRRRRLEEYLDRGWGVCWLRQPVLATKAEAALRFFDGKRYHLHAWVVMPNHVHVVVEVWQTPLARLIQSWKRFSGREANRIVGREGAFWEREYWDTLIKSDAQLVTAVRYTEANPVKAGLVQEAKEWAWSSARLRDGASA
jgi:putative transposase